MYSYRSKSKFHNHCSQYTSDIQQDIVYFFYNFIKNKYHKIKQNKKKKQE